MSELLKDLLFHLRQHPGFPEFLEAIQATERPAFRPAKGLSVEQYGAVAIFSSGERSHADQVTRLLTGGDSSQTEETS